MLNLIPIATTKNIAKEYTQNKMGKECKHFTILKKVSQTGNKGQKKKKI